MTCNDCKHFILTVRGSECIYKNAPSGSWKNRLCNPNGFCIMRRDRIRNEKEVVE